MQTSKMYERIDWYRKEYVHDYYSRIVEKFKDYDKISKKKMIESIYKVYDNYDNIIDICTTKELKYLEKILDKKTSMEELLSDKYEWERKTLRNKFLIQDEHDRVFIPDEIMDNVKMAIKNINWNVVKKLTTLNEILIGYFKTQGSASLQTASAVASMITGIDEDMILTHMIHNKVFNYYIYIYQKDFEALGNSVLIGMCQEYYGLEDEIDERRKEQAIIGTMPINVELFKILFYNDFDISNKKIAQFLKKLKKLPFFWNRAIDIIKESALLNMDRKSLKESMSNVQSLRDYNLTNFFVLLDKAMDEMPSGVLNGLTLNQVKKILLEQEENKRNKEKSYVKQQNAHLSKKDAQLFYKIYFGLLEFTNNKYKIKTNFKIYEKIRINPYDLSDIVEKFWENKKEIVSEFCDDNPYRFNKEELDITSQFKKGFREIIIIAKFETEYTAVMNENKVYMIKGINDNIDNIISLKISHYQY